MTAFEQAWSLLKALPEQQMFEQRSRPAPYGSITDMQQQRLGTVHPAIVGMLSRLQHTPRGYAVRPDLRVLERGQLAHDPVMIEGRTPLSIENYGKYFDEGRAAFAPYDTKLHTGHFDIPLASGDRVENSSPLRPRDISYEV
tara:strand:+ start:466 stop:891 length:426 start_codon:yes stop_codon:yes gene_type:complete